MEKEINIINIEKTYENILNIDNYNLKIILEKLSKSCNLNTENLIGFSEKLYEYKFPPELNNLNNVLINYILSDKKNTIIVDLDIYSLANNSWDFYKPKNPKNNSIRIVLDMPIKVMVNNEKQTKLILPKGFSVDILSINNIPVNNRLNIENLFLTSKFYQSFRTDDILEIKCKKYTLPKIEVLNKFNIDKYISEFINNINKEVQIYPSKLYSMYEFIEITKRKLLLPILINYIITNNIDNQNYKLINKNNNREYKKNVDKNNKATLEIKNNLINEIIRNNYSNIYYENINLKYYNQLYNFLNKKEIDNIERKYELLKKYRESVINNQCPHLEISMKLRNDPSIESKKFFLNKLKPFIANPKEKDHFHICNKCHLNVICPHVMDLMQLLFNGASEMDIRNKLDKYINKNNSTPYEIFCKICNEKLFSSTYEEIAHEGYRILYKEIFKYCWSQMLNIFVTLTIVPRVNIFDFSSLIVYNILPLIVKPTIPEIESEISKYIQTNELTGNLKSIIIMYIYSFILHMIKESMDNYSKDNVRIDLIDSENCKSTSDYAKKITSRFISMHRSVFNTSNEEMYKLFIVIYTELSQKGIDFLLKRNNNNSVIIFNNVINSTIFNYAFNISLFTKISTYNKNIIFNNNYEDMIEKILGMKIIDIVNNKSINNYSKVYQPTYNEKNIKLYESILSRNNLKLNDLNRIYRTRISYSYKLFMKNYLNIFQNKYQKDIFDNNLNYENTIYETIAVIQLTNDKEIDCVLNYKKPKYKIDRRLTAVYNEKGHMHNWNTLIYEDGTELLIGKGYITKYQKIVDFKDSQTGIFKSDTYKLNINLTYKSYIKQNKRNIFFNFYKTRCPKMGIHEYSDDLICVKCGFKENTKDKKYFDLYYNRFLEESEEINSLEIPKRFDNYNKEYKDINWTYNPKSITELSSIINEPDYVITSIGAMENRTIQDVKMNRNRPDFPKNKSSMQLYRIISYYYITISLYNKLIYSNLSNPFFIEEMKKTNLNFVDISNNKNKMSKTLFVKYNDIIDKIINDNKINYEYKYLGIVQNLCSFIMDVYNIPNIGKFIAKYFIRNILKQEFETTLSSGKFDKSVLLSEDSVIFNENNIYRDNFDIEIEDKDIYKEGDMKYEDVDIINNT